MSRLSLPALIAIVLVALAACDATGSAQGGGNGDAAHGRVRVGIPF